MKVLGVIVEYNPFHVGHLHHLKTSKELTNAEYVVAVMSGNFVQRGEPAIIDKFARAEMALKAGVDVVFELPTIYAIQDASGFASGSIGMLNATNVVTDVVFGSETNDVDNLSRIADIILEEPFAYRQFLKKYLKEGFSFPNARRYALCDMMPELDSETIKQSNNILGVEYMVALKKMKSQIKAHTIKRIGASYNDENISSIPSATAIRKAIAEKRELKEIKGLPDFSLEILERELENGRGPIFLNDLFEIFKFKMLMLSREGLENLYGFNEGMAKRMIDNLDRSHVEEFLKLVKTKRFTLTRIRRRILYALLDVTRNLVLDSNEYGPQYLRVLGFRERGRKVLRDISKHSSIPIISNVSGFNRAIEKRNVYMPLAKEQMNLDIKATDMYSMLFKRKKERKMHRDFKKVLIER
ncbi:nucleotidyltransferase [Mesoaciditoga lauensis]|uniref:nucleotidyltransferase n=1 Tax=Mesoaciditoga lauensis TaxID=1495039 RepID=UPI00055D34E3|nr:nucleotidyltransferase [Mesoaciditoga lauensis]